MTNDFAVLKQAGAQAEKAFDWGMKLNQSAEAARRVADSIKAMTAEPVEMAMSAQTAFVLLQRRTGLVGASFQKLQDDISGLGAGSTFDTLQLTQAVTLLTKRGFDATQALAQLPNVMAFAEGQQISLGEATEMTSTIMAKFQASTSETAHFTDVLTKAAVLSGFGIKEIGGALQASASDAKQFGMGLDTSAGILAGFVKGATSAERGGSALSTMLSHLVSPRAKHLIGAGMQEVFGADITSDTIKKKLQDIPALLAEVTSKTQGMSGMKQAQIFSQIFGDETIASIMRVVGPSGLGAFIEQTTKSKGAAKDLADDLSTTATEANKRYEASLKRLKTALGGPLLEGMTNFLNKVVGVVDGITTWSKEHPTLTAGIMKTLKAAGLLVGAVAGILFGTAGLCGALGILNVALGVKLTLAILAKAIPAMAAWIFTTGTSAVVAVGSFVVSIVSSAIPALGSMAIAAWAAIAPFLPFALAIAGVGLAIYEVIKNWDALKASFADSDTLIKDLGNLLNPFSTEESRQAARDAEAAKNNTPELVRARYAAQLAARGENPSTPLLAGQLPSVANLGSIAQLGRSRYSAELADVHHRKEKTEVGGELKIKIEGPATVTSMTAFGGLDITADTGVAMVTP